MFKYRRTLLGAFALTLGLALILAWAGGPGVRAQDESPTVNRAPLGTAFTYQGQLTDDGEPAVGPCDFRFSLFDAASDGAQVGSTLTQIGVELSDGRFTVILDFGVGVFTGDARWLEIAVKCAEDSAYTTLGRQAFTAAPYALALPGLWTESNTTSPNLIGGYRGNEVSAGVVGATISGGGSGAFPNRVTEYYATIGGGEGNTTTALYATVGGGYANTAGSLYATVAGGFGNATSGSYTTVGGGHSNTAGGLYATVGGGIGNTATGYYATVSGGDSNATSGEHATVSGGDSNDVGGDNATVGGGSYNNASGEHATVAGGYSNNASGEHATVGGGYDNDASGNFATVGGGYFNHATGFMATAGGGRDNVASNNFATVGGGYDNDASSGYATVGGGASNEASGYAATIPGGSDNDATGHYSFAAGRRAQALHEGSFVLADSTDADFFSVREDALRVRFNGGATFVVNDDYWVRFWSNAGALIDTSTGAHLTTGGVWTNGSDREAKENFAPVNGQALLVRLAEMPIQTWNYKAEDPAVRRMGPTAQDFYAAFGLGEDDLHISTIDADGVALVAIQVLYERSQVLEGENAALQGQLADMEARLAALEQAAGASQAPLSNPPDSWSFPRALGEFVESAGWWVMGGLLVGAVMARRKFAGGGR